MSGQLHAYVRHAGMQPETGSPNIRFGTCLPGLCKMREPAVMGCLFSTAVYHSSHSPLTYRAWV